MPVNFAKRRVGEFLYGGLLSPETQTEGAWAAPDLAMDSGTPVALKGVGDAAVLVPFDHAAVAGSGPDVFVGFLYEPVVPYADAGADAIRVSYIARGPQGIDFSYGRVPLLGTNTVDEIVAAWAGLGFVRRG